MQELLFSCLMAAISIDGELYNLAFHFRLSVEAIGVVISRPAACMGALVFCSCSDCGSVAFLVQFGACLGFEVRGQPRLHPLHTHMRARAAPLRARARTRATTSPRRPPLSQAAVVSRCSSARVVLAGLRGRLPARASRRTARPVPTRGSRR